MLDETTKNQLLLCTRCCLIRQNGALESSTSPNKKPHSEHRGYDRWKVHRSAEKHPAVLEET